MCGEGNIMTKDEALRISIRNAIEHINHEAYNDALSSLWEANELLGVPITEGKVRRMIKTPTRMRKSLPPPSMLGKDNEQTN